MAYIPQHGGTLMMRQYECLDHCDAGHASSGSCTTGSKFGRANRRQIGAPLSRCRRAPAILEDDFSRQRASARGHPDSVPLQGPAQVPRDRGAPPLVKLPANREVDSNKLTSYWSAFVITPQQGQSRFSGALPEPGDWGGQGGEKPHACMDRFCTLTH